MPSIRRLIRDIFTGSITETLGNLLAEYIKPLLPILIPGAIGLAALALSWLRGWLFQAVSVPVWVLLVGSLVLVTSPSIFYRIRRYFQGRSLQEHYDVLWKLENGELLGGPFCPRDKRVLAVSRRRHSLSDMVTSMKPREQSRPYIVLECPQCDFRKRIDCEDLEHLKSDVQDYVAAQNR